MFAESRHLEKEQRENDIQKIFYVMDQWMSYEKSVFCFHE